MNGNFEYHNTTKLIFGPDSLDKLSKELEGVGNNVLLVYGSGSIKKTGLYEKVINILTSCGKNVAEDSGVMSNPTTDKLYEGIKRARTHHTDFILAVGGGSVIDYTKALAASINFDGDPWDEYYVKFNEPTVKIIPHGNILTMCGTGSEANGGAVITNSSNHLKIGHVFGSDNLPKFAILNPILTYTVPEYQMSAGIFDTMSHIMEQYFSDHDDSTSDYIMEGLMRSLVASSKVAIKEPTNYEARSNIMWTSTWALNTLVGCGKTQDWMVHMIGQSIGGVTNATHGMTLSAISYAYYNYLLNFEVDKFVRFAHNVFDVSITEDKLYTAKIGLDRLLEWMKEIKVATSLKDISVDESKFDDIIKGTLISKGSGYHDFNEEEIRLILKNSL